jgi:hypothetical protein
MGGIIMRWVAVWAVMMLVGLPALWARDDVKDKPKEPEKSKIAVEVRDCPIRGVGLRIM